MNSTAPHYVRCVKPNHFKRPDDLEVGEVLRQLRYAGMMETVRIRQQGYALRLPHGEFFRRYRLLVPRSRGVYVSKDV